MRDWGSDVCSSDLRAPLIRSLGGKHSVRRNPPVRAERADLLGHLRAETELAATAGGMARALLRISVMRRLSGNQTGLPTWAGLAGITPALDRKSVVKGTSV